MNGDFPTLEEFLLLVDETDIHKRSIHRDEYLIYEQPQRRPDSLAVDYVNRYKLARQNWICYREEGPPPGTICRDLRTGQHHTMIGISNRDDRYFQLMEEHKRYTISIPRAHWWALIQGLT